MNFNLITEHSTDLMFVEDHQGHTVFFPSGWRGKGYILNDRGLRKQTVRFFKWSMVVIFMASTIISTLIIHEAWSIIVGLAIWGVVWYFAWKLYIRWVTFSLLSVEQSYREVILAKIEAESRDRWESQEPAKYFIHPKKVTFSTWKNLFNWKKLTQGFNLGIAYLVVFLLCFLSFSIWDAIPASKDVRETGDKVELFLFLFVFGLLGFIMVRLFAAEKPKLRDWLLHGFIYILLMVFWWGMMLFFLYKDFGQLLFH